MNKDLSKLIISAAGSGKTSYLVEFAKNTTKKVLITTYTDSNKEEIEQKFGGFIPENVTILTWYSFLLKHGVRPFQDIMHSDLFNKEIGFYLVNGKSGAKLDKYGKPIIYQGRKLYWSEEKNFFLHYFTNKLKLYSDKTSKFVFNCNKKLKTNSRDIGGIVTRISKIFPVILIDEAQDLAGYDLELIRLLISSKAQLVLAGDPRQCTYQTHIPLKNTQYSKGNIKSYFEDKIPLSKGTIDTLTLNLSHRNDELICNYSSKLYSTLPPSKKCDCENCNIQVGNVGIHLIRPKDLPNYRNEINPEVELRWSMGDGKKVWNFGESKGKTFNRVILHPTKDMASWIRDNKFKLKEETRAKFYVALTRARYSVGIVFDYKDDEQIDGTIQYVANKED